MTAPRHWPASLTGTDSHAQLVTAVAQDRRNAVSVHVLTDELQQAYGLSDEQAADVIGEASNVLYKANQPTRPRALNRIKTGALWLVIGLGFTYFSYMGALDGAGNGRYYVAIGAILWGAFTFLRGLSEFMSAPK